MQVGWHYVGTVPSLARHPLKKSLEHFEEAVSASMKWTLIRWPRFTRKLVSLLLRICFEIPK